MSKVDNAPIAPILYYHRMPQVTHWSPAAGRFFLCSYLWSQLEPRCILSSPRQTSWPGWRAGGNKHADSQLIHFKSEETFNGTHIKYIIMWIGVSPQCPLKNGADFWFEEAEGCAGFWSVWQSDWFASCLSQIQLCSYIRATSNSFKFLL